MNVETKKSTKELLIENLWDGDLFVHNNKTFILLTDELFCQICTKNIMQLILKQVNLNFLLQIQK